MKRKNGHDTNGREKYGGVICELAATCPEGMQRWGAIKSDRRLRAAPGKRLLKDEYLYYEDSP